MSLCFVFVCQGGSIEPKAVLLAASLRTFIRSDAEIVAAVPDYPEVEPPSAEAVSFLRGIGVRIENIGNEVDPSYPIANKIACFNIRSRGERFVFLDSDILCLRHPDEFFEGDEWEFGARLTDFSDLDAQEWRDIYRYLGRADPVPDQRSLVTGTPMPLCFNSGVVVTTQPGRLHRAWTDFARKLNHPDRFAKTRPFLDQISLPFAVRDLGLKVRLFGQRTHWSSPVFPLDLYDPPSFVHYYEPIHLVGDGLLAKVAERLIREYGGLRELLHSDPFLALLGPAGRADWPPGPEAAGSTGNLTKHSRTVGGTSPESRA